ncbi:MAG: hypothetical protein Q9206_004939 [Seirophora lacunosa]
MPPLWDAKRRACISPEQIETLRSSVGTSRVLTPDSDAYIDKIKRWADSARKQAGAVLLPNSSSDISTVVQFAQAHDLDFAVCAGGHSTSGSSSSDGGLVIDLSLMRTVAIDPEAKTITAQGGCTWADVDAAAGKHGLATVGGTVNHTGVGGLTLGGGYGWLSGQHGLAIDQLLSVEMVLANGQVVTTSATENADLFWAIRGAGQSFGVATSFIFRAHEQNNPVFAGPMAFTPDKIPAAVAFGNRLMETGNGQAGCILGFAVAPPPVGQPMLMSVIFYNGPEAEAKTFFKPLFDLEPVMNTTGMVPYPLLNEMLNHVAGHGGRKSTKGASFNCPVRPDFMLSAFQNFASFVRDVPDASGSLLLFEFIHQAKICETSNRAMAFANRDFYGNVLAGPKWYDEANDDRCRQWARDVTDLLRREMETAKIEGRVRPEMEGVGRVRV